MLNDLTRRSWIAAALALPLFLAGMSDLIPGKPLRAVLSPGWLAWIELALATPAVLWAGWPFLQRGWASVVNRSLNMSTLTAIGTGAAYLFSVVGTAAPWLFPESRRGHGGAVLSGATGFAPPCTVIAPPPRQPAVVDTAPLPATTVGVIVDGAEVLTAPHGRR